LEEEENKAAALETQELRSEAPRALWDWSMGLEVVEKHPVTSEAADTQAAEAAAPPK